MRGKQESLREVTLTTERRRYNPPSWIPVHSETISVRVTPKRLIPITGAQITTQKETI